MCKKIAYQAGYKSTHVQNDAGFPFPIEKERIWRNATNAPTSTTKSLARLLFYALENVHVHFHKDIQ